MQDSLLEERKAKEFEQQTNYDLKQNELDLIKKIEILNKNNLILKNKYDDEIRTNQSITDTLSKLNKNIMDLRVCNEKINNEYNISLNELDILRNSQDE